MLRTCPIAGRWISRGMRCQRSRKIQEIAQESRRPFLSTTAAIDSCRRRRCCRKFWDDQDSRRFTSLIFVDDGLSGRATGLMASSQLCSSSATRCGQNQYSLSSTTNRPLGAVATGTELIDQHESDDGGNNNQIEETNILTKRTAEERGVRDNEISLKIKALEAELPGIVEQILVFHEQTETSTTSRNNMLRAKWEQAFRAEYQDHSLRLASETPTTRPFWLSSSSVLSDRLDPASAQTFWSGPESLSRIHSSEAGPDAQGGHESSSLWNSMGPSAEDDLRSSDAPEINCENHIACDDHELMSTSEANRNAKDNLFSPTFLQTRISVPTEKAEKLDEVFHEQEHRPFAPLEIEAGHSDGCSSESQTSTNSLVGDSIFGRAITGSSVTSIVPVDKTVQKESAFGISDNPLTLKSTPGGSMRERKDNVNMSSSDQSKKHKDAVTRAVVLLRLMTAEDWRAFSNFSNETDENENDAQELYSTISERLHDKQPGMSTAELALEGADYDKRDSEDDDSSRDGVKGVTNASIKTILDLPRSQRAATDLHLSTPEYNSVLARVALSLELSPDNVLDLLMQFHSQMEGLARAGFTEAKPDATTYEILLLTLYHRLLASGNAASIIQKFMVSNPSCWTSNALEAAMLILRKQHSTKVAFRLFDDQTERSIDSEIDITKRAYRCLVYLTQFDDNKEKAIAVLEHALRKNSRKHDRELDAVFVDAIRWPRKNRFGKEIDNSVVLSDIISMLEKERIYSPGITVWTELVDAATRGARQDESRWSLISRVFTCLTWSFPGYCPNQRLLRYGLQASKALNDPVLASDLIWRSVINSREGKPFPAEGSATLSSDNLRGPGIPFMDFASAMDICVNKGDMISSRKILTSAKRAGVTGRNLRALFLLNMKGFAYRGEVDNCELLIVDMLDKSLEPNEECYAALLHAYAVANNLDRAQKLFQSLESGEMGLVPGPATYDAYALACIRCRVWSKVMEAYKSMKERGIPPSPPTCHGILFSAFKVGRKSAVRMVLEDFLAAGLLLTEASVVFAMKILIPSKVFQKTDSLASARQNLRTMTEDDASLLPSTLELLRSLRQCELAEERRPSGGLSEHAVQEERIKAWQSVLESLLAYVDRLESRATSAKTMVDA